MIDAIFNTTLGDVLGFLFQHWGIALVFLLGAMFYTMMNTWAQYLGMMHLKEKRDELKAEGKDFTLPQKIFGFPALIRGLFWDVFLNFFVGSVCFFEVPRYDLKDDGGKREILFTARVSRWNDTGGKRGDIARWFCEHFLDPFEKGGHCS